MSMLQWECLNTLQRVGFKEKLITSCYFIFEQLCSPMEKCREGHSWGQEEMTWAMRSGRGMGCTWCRRNHPDPHPHLISLKPQTHTRTSGRSTTPGPPQTLTLTRLVLKWKTQYCNCNVNRNISYKRMLESFCRGTVPLASLHIFITTCWAWLLCPTCYKKYFISNALNSLHFFILASLSD